VCTSENSNIKRIRTVKLLIDQIDGEEKVLKQLIIFKFIRFVNYNTNFYVVLKGVDISEVVFSDSEVETSDEEEDEEEMIDDTFEGKEKVKEKQTPMILRSSKKVS
jgi:hypothetical protein